MLCGIAMVAAALSMRLCASIWLETVSAWILSMLYSANPYFLLCGWIHSSYAEILSAALFLF
jgi:hypothetical protein